MELGLLLRRDRGLRRRLVARPLVREPAEDGAEHEEEREAPRRDHQVPLVFVLLERGDVPLVLLLVPHLLDARRVLGVEAGLLDLGVTDRIEARLLLTPPLLLGAAAVLLGADAALFLLAGTALGVHARLELRLLLRLPGVLLGADPILLEVHQLFEGEKDRALFLFRHGRFSSYAIPGPAVASFEAARGGMFVA